MVGDIKEVQSKARTMAGAEVKQEEGAKKKGNDTEFKKEDVSEGLFLFSLLFTTTSISFSNFFFSFFFCVESLKAFADRVYQMYDEQCADEIKIVLEFPDEVARLKVCKKTPKKKCGFSKTKFFFIFR
jgi:hypothetical protein